MIKRGTVQSKSEANIAPIPPQESQSGSKPGLGDDHPLNDIIGTYEGPVWERILKKIKRNRRNDDREALANSE